MYNNTAIINITYPSTIDNNLYRIEPRLIEAGGNNLTNIKIKDFSNIRQLTINELRLSQNYTLTVTLVNKATNMKSAASEPLIINITAPAPAPAVRRGGGNIKMSPRVITIKSIPIKKSKKKSLTPKKNSKKKSLKRKSKKNLLVK